jgi:hypothetical protein
MALKPGQKNPAHNREATRHGGDDEITKGEGEGILLSLGAVLSRQEAAENSQEGIAALLPLRRRVRPPLRLFHCRSPWIAPPPTNQPDRPSLLPSPPRVPGAGRARLPLQPRGPEAEPR